MLGRDQRAQAQSIYDSTLARDLQERQFKEQIRQFNENMKAQERQAAAARAAQQANIGAYLGGGGSTKAPAAAQIQRTKSGGYNFFDSAGRPINAAQYSQLTGVGYRELLSKMAADGDSNARIALQYVGNDGRFGGAPKQYQGALSALGAQGSYVTDLSKPITKGGASLPSIFNGKW